MRLIQRAKTGSLSREGTENNRNRMGEIQGSPVWDHSTDIDDNSTQHDADAVEALFETVCSTVERFCQLDDTNTNPGIVLAQSKPPAELYWQAVHDVVELSKVEKILNKSSFMHKGYKNRRGLIGACAALAWEPAVDSARRAPGRTFELIAYRDRARWGSERVWDPKSAAVLSNVIPTSFDNYDFQNDIPRILPHTPCPVLYGIRGTASGELPRALEVVNTEESVDRWVIFETNHASDDHIQPLQIRQFQPYQSVQLGGGVTSEPMVMKGGHTFFELKDAEGDRVICAAYEPTKQFRDVVKGLIPGDKIVIYGGLRGPNGSNGDLFTGSDQKVPTVNLEKLEILGLEKEMGKVSNPRCPSCKKAMKSIGTNQGYRCKACGIHVDESAAEFAPEARKLELGFYEVPPCARRHLSCPIELFNKS
ncbi:MAG: DUF1743 domain-containing protein [Thermoplasmata archaeon]|nr:MAG: DUF1743 domain-containing protein [Thermoplasmata archaeon]